MTFELIVTESCNRNCRFCQIKKNNIIEKTENLQYFCNYVNTYPQKCEVNFFGGEPLLNVPAIDYCVDNLKESIKLNLYTNGDNLHLIYDKPYINRLNIQVTAYDIFENYEKYQEMCQKNKDILFSYTFDQDDIDRIDEYNAICREKLNGNFKFALSHSNSSWNKICDEELKEKIQLLVKNEIKDSIYHHRLSRFLESKVKRLVELQNNVEIQEFTCLNGQKMTFCDGKFLEIPCVLYKDVEILNENRYENCLNCEYKKICTKSCYHECFGGEVPKKLCIIEKTQFEILKSVFFVNNNTLN